LHISEHFVIVYLIFQNYVVFIELGHHDKAYDNAELLMKRILEDERLLDSLGKLSIPVDDFADFVRALSRPRR
jgi:hypothetical protein